MSVVAQEGAAALHVNQRQVMGAVVASCMGWALDLFDLFVLLYVAPVVGRLFFPSEHAMLSLAAVYASFAVTLLMRPLGSALFGSYADRHGRKGAMIVAVVGVGLSTAAFGMLPTVAQVGLVAPVLFMLLRLVQGVFVGGVVASTHTIGTESVAPKYRGAVSGLIGGGGAGLGALLASLTYLAMSSLFPGDLFDVWGWRCMFFTGILSSLLGLFVFNSLEESPLWKKLAAEKAAKAAAQVKSGQAEVVRSPVRTLFSRDYRKVLFVNLLLTIGGGSGYYLTSGYLPTFLKVVSHVPNGAAAAILMICSGRGGGRRLRCGGASEHVHRAQERVRVARPHPAGRAACALRAAADRAEHHDDRRVRGAALRARQRGLCADPDLPERALSDCDPRDRDGSFMEYRLRDRRDDADLRLARREGCEPVAVDARDLRRRDQRDLPDRRVRRARDARQARKRGGAQSVLKHASIGGRAEERARASSDRKRRRSS
ncbi:MFS family permease [Paraburkholderia sp. Clong3]